MAFTPRYSITPRLSKFLADIAVSKQSISELPISLHVLESLRESARLRTTHYSTQIEGNRLTQEQITEVLKGGTFPNRQRDELEVKNYYMALDYLDELIANKSNSISENQIKTIHSLVYQGKRKSSAYREGQNVIKDSKTGGIVYMPPEAKDVSALMKELISWINEEMRKDELPPPIIAAIAHYQFATIHPYYDGNGRSARLLTNLILHKSGYGLNGIYSLEEYYATDLQRYYDALTIGESHNYYFGRVEAEITSWVEYFCSGMAEAGRTVKAAVKEASTLNEIEKENALLLRELDQRQKLVLSLFRESKYVTTAEIAKILQIQSRSTLNICKKWIEDEFIIQNGNSNKTRKYELNEKWVRLIIK